VIEGAQGEEHGAVICKLCQRHNKTNNFAGEGYKYPPPLQTLDL